jgi:hypothetical protein
VGVVPALHFLQVPASMHGVEIGKWLLEASDPFVGNKAGISVAHENLSQYLDAVICILNIS